MRRRRQTTVAYALLVLFTGTMLPGQALHLCGPSDGEVACAGHEHHAADHMASDGSPELADNDAPCHDPSACLVCQFYGQGQLAASTSALELVQPLSAEVASAAHAAAVIPLAGLHNPRGPPQA